MDFSPPGSSIHWIFQTRVLEWYILVNVRLDESQTGIKIAGRNTNKQSYADDTILMAGSEEEAESLLMKMKEESEKTGLKLNIQKSKIMASSPITSWQTEGEKVSNFIFLGSTIDVDCDCCHKMQ